MSDAAIETAVEVDDRPWRTLAELAERGDPEVLRAWLEELPAGEGARCMAHLDEGARQLVLVLLSPQAAAALLEDMPHAQAASLVEEMDAPQAAAILEELRSDERTDVLQELEDDDAAAILAEMAPEAAAQVHDLVRHDPEHAGGLMVREVVSYRDDACVRDVLDDLRENAEKYSDYDVQYAYVVDRDGRLTGVLRLRDLVLAAPRRPIADLALKDPLSVRADTDLDALEDFFDDHAFIGVPVLDADGRLAGVVRRADVQRALDDRSQSDRMKEAGIVGGEELRSMPLLLRARRRLAWLSPNIGLNLISASVIALFTDTLESVIALAVFLPIISDMSGCSGNQAVAVSMRELSLGLARPTDAAHVWLKEAGVAVLNGLVLGSIVAFVAYAWQGNAWLGLVVGLALAVNTVLAATLGGVLPLLLKRAGLDPALGSGPILTTVTDLCGFFFVLGFATLLLPRLV